VVKELIAPRLFDCDWRSDECQMCIISADAYEVVSRRSNKDGIGELGMQYSHLLIGTWLWLQD